MSGTDYYWPLDTLVDGRALGTVLATSVGNVSMTDRLQNEKEVLYFPSFPAYLDMGMFTGQCITHPDNCDNGMTLSFVVNFEDVAMTWTTNTFIVDTIGDQTLQDSRGFAVYVANRMVYVSVFSRRMKWVVSEPLITGVWQHIVFTWLQGSGLSLYVNGLQK